MTATAFTCEAPTDAQLAKLAEICGERGIEPLPVVYSRGDASACITAILRREYDPAAWVSPYFGLDRDDEDVP